MHVVKPSLTDKFLLEEILKLKNKYNVKTFIETGTHVGESAIIASNHFERVITCENHDWYFERANSNLINFKNIELYKKSSLELFDEIFPIDEVCIIFLDAHGENDFPLKGELNRISKNKTKHIIIIHDFYVPDENGNAKFPYDTYMGSKLDLNYILDGVNLIYGDGNYDYYFLPNQELSGVIYIVPKNN
jgi:hypothetical protein